jgi:hypothetical protein
MIWNSFVTPVDMVGPVLTRWTRFWPNMTVLTWNGRKLIFYPGRHGLTRIDAVDSVLTRNDLKLVFYPGRHGLTHIDSVDSVLTENDGFDSKRPETHFLPWSTWFDPYWPSGIGSYGKMRLTRAKYFCWILNFFLIFLDFYK